MLSDDDAIAQADALLADAGNKRWSPPSIDNRIEWGKYKGKTYRQLADHDPGYAKWAATTIGGLKGQLCAEALAHRLGVME